jgi:hypothetical protein
MFTVGMYAEAYTDKQEAVTYTDKQEAVTVVAENSKREFTVRVGYLTRLLYTVVAISTAEGARITVKEDDFTAIANYLHLNK